MTLEPVVLRVQINQSRGAWCLHAIDGTRFHQMAWVVSFLIFTQVVRDAPPRF